VFGTSTGHHTSRSTPLRRINLEALLQVLGSSSPCSLSVASPGVGPITGNRSSQLVTSCRLSPRLRPPTPNAPSRPAARRHEVLHAGMRASGKRASKFGHCVRQIDLIVLLACLVPLGARAFPLVSANFFIISTSRDSGMRLWPHLAGYSFSFNVTVPPPNRLPELRSPERSFSPSFFLFVFRSARQRKRKLQGISSDVLCFARKCTVAIWARRKHVGAVDKHTHSEGVVRVRLCDASHWCMRVVGAPIAYAKSPEQLPRRRTHEMHGVLQARR
jgi:hypothetical protein